MNPDPDATLVGNDIVDLRDPRSVGRSEHIRFLERVLAPPEARRVRDAPDPDHAIWAMWTAKEAAFKVVSKLLGDPPPFVHARFVTSLSGTPGHPLPDRFEATVEYEDQVVPVRIERTERWIHAVGWAGPAGEPVEGAAVASGEATIGRSPAGDEHDGPYRLLLEERFSPRERRSIHSPASAYARLLARRALAEALTIDERRLEIVCGPTPNGRVPPMVLVDDEPGPADVSLSHHGQMVAWAFRTRDERR